MSYATAPINYERFLGTAAAGVAKPEDSECGYRRRLSSFVTFAERAQQATCSRRELGKRLSGFVMCSSGGGCSLLAI